jgi:hypothetical protein
MLHIHYRKHGEESVDIGASVINPLSAVISYTVSMFKIFTKYPFWAK